MRRARPPYNARLTSALGLPLRLAWLCRTPTAPALRFCTALWSANSFESIQLFHYVGEPFCRRDIQFQHPQVRVALPPTLDQSFRFFLSRAPFDVGPGVASVLLKDSFHSHFRDASFRKDDDDRAGLLVALLNHCTEAGIAFRDTKQRAYGHGRGEARLHASRDSPGGC